MSRFSPVGSRQCCSRQLGRSSRGDDRRRISRRRRKRVYCMCWWSDRSTTEAPPRWNRFFQQLADPKTALQPLTEMHLPMFKTKECRCRSRPLAPNFNVAGSSRNKAMIQTERLHPHQKSPSTCTTLKLGGARGGLSSNPTCITMFPPHYLSIVSSLSNRFKRANIS